MLDGRTIHLQATFTNQTLAARFALNKGVVLMWFMPKGTCWANTWTSWTTDLSSSCGAAKDE